MVYTYPVYSSLTPETTSRIIQKTDLKRKEVEKTVAKRFGFPSYQRGLSDILNKNISIEECIITDEKSGIDLLPAGQYTTNSLELFSNSNFFEIQKMS